MMSAAVTSENEAENSQHSGAATTGPWPPPALPAHPQGGHTAITTALTTVVWMGL